MGRHSYVYDDEIETLLLQLPASKVRPESRIHLSLLRARANGRTSFCRSE